MAKGLIYRELQLSKKTYITSIALFLGFTLLGFLVRLSMSYGNLAKLDADTFKSIDLYSYYVFSLLPAVLILFSCIGDGGVIVSDYRSRWNLFSYTLPVSEKKQAGIKYLIKACSMLLALVLALANAAIIGLISDRGLSFSMVKYILIIMLVAVVLSSITTPMLLKYKSTNAVIFRIVGLFVAAYLIIAMLMMSFINSFRINHPDISGLNFDDVFVDELLEKVNKIKVPFLTAAPFVITAIILISFWLTVRRLKRREK